MAYIMALDQGTTASRTLIFDERGELLSSSKQEFPQYFPQPEQVEHRAQEIWDSQQATMQQALAQAGLKLADMTCLGITNQRETVLLWERATGEPLYNALVWQDQRTAAFMQELAARGLGEQIQQKTGLLLDPYFAASKLKWLLDKVPGARQRAAAGELAAGTMDTWLIYKLSGGKRLVTDVTNAARTMLFDIHKCQWDDELLELFEIPKKLLPQVVPSSIPVAIAPTTQAETFGAAVPITGIAGDQHAALLGQGCTQVGMIKNTYGTGCFMLMMTGTTAVPSANGLLTTLAWQLPDQPPQYALEGSVFIAGSVIQWLRDGLQLIKSAPEVNELAAADNGGVYFVPAFAGLGSPHWDAQARGMIIGLTRGTSRGHLARAALESIAFQSVELAAAMQRDIKAQQLEYSCELRADGGVTASKLFMQIQADLLGAKLQTARLEETTALGAAYFAGLAVGIWPDLQQLHSSWRAGATYEPALPAATRTARLAKWAAAVERAKGWAAAGEA